MKRLFPLLSSAVLLACGTSTTPDAGHGSVTELRFKAKVGTADFACGTTYTLGTTGSAYKPRDFRLYVSELTLITETSTKVPFVLTNDGAFQADGLALIDFENATGECGNGTAETHTTLTGTAPGDRYDAVEFTVGVPFERNHQDATTAAAPLNSTAMFWSWQGGYKFLRADGLTTGLPMGHNVHLGSTGCMPGAAPNSVTSCATPNRVRVSLSGFAEKTSAIVIDLEALLAGSDLDTDMPMSAPGCMSGATDVDCAPIFERLGLPFGTAAAKPQRVFKLEN